MKRMTYILTMIILSIICQQSTAQIKTVTISNKKIESSDSLTLKLSNKVLLIPKTIEIKEDKDFSMTEQMPWIVALIIGSISYMLGRGQIQIQQNLMTSTSRQAWINTLRDNISDYIGKIEHFHIRLTSLKDDNLRKEDRKELAKENFFQEILSLKVKIELLLNPNEINSQKLMKELNDYSDSVFDEMNEETKETILSITKDILKTEWERVKKAK